MARITLPESGIETLFGSYDENLKHLESQFGVRVRTQGHDVIVDGPPAEVAKVERLFTQLGALFQEGYRVSNGDVKTAAQLIASDPNIDLREYFLKSTQTQSGKRRDRPEDRQPASLSRCDRAERHRLRHRTGRHGQDVPGDGTGRVVSAGEARELASSLRGRRSKRVRSWDSCRAICRRR